MSKQDDQDFDLENIEFKPLTKGLGFHHKERNQKTILGAPGSLKENLGETNKRTLRTGSLQSRGKRNLGISESFQSENNVSQSGLGAFYGQSQQEGMFVEEQVESIHQEIEQEMNREPIIEKESYELASKGSQLMAWLIDMGLLIGIIALAAFGFHKGLNIGVDFFLRTMTPIELASYSGTLFSLLYIIYFSVLEVNQTFGKAMMGIRLVKSDDSSPRMKEALLRSIISLLSIGVCFVPMLIDFQGKLTDTKVVKDK